MIEKKIHWCWFGNAEITPLSKACIESWSKYNPDYEIIKWSESECNEIKNNPFFSKAIKNKMWAFAADYARLWILYKYGGIYLDTDMEIIKSIDVLLKDNCFFGMEDDRNISAGIIGSTKGHPAIKEMLDYYESNTNFINIPILLTKVINEKYDDIKIYSFDFFYPYNPNRSDSLKQFTMQSITKNTIGIHHWEKKWKLSIYQRLLRKITLYNY